MSKQLSGIKTFCRGITTYRIVDEQGNLVATMTEVEYLGSAVARSDGAIMRQECRIEGRRNSRPW